MKLTKREKILLFGALIIIAVAVLFTYVYMPLTKEVKELQVQSEDITIQLQDAQTRQGLINELEKQLITVSEEVKTKHQDILKVWDQAELLVFVENTIDELCEKESIDFYDIVEVDKVRSGDIGIKIKTNYEDLQKIWDKFENAKYFNTVTSFDITEAEESSFDAEELETNDLETDGIETDFQETDVLNTDDSEKVITETAENQKELEITMNLRFYSQNLGDTYPKEYDFMDGEYGKTNIFE